jgi:hypothetical protein
MDDIWLAYENLMTLDKIFRQIYGNLTNYFWPPCQTDCSEFLFILNFQKSSREQFRPLERSVAFTT